MYRTEDYRRHQVEKRKRRYIKRRLNYYPWFHIEYAPGIRRGKYWVHGRPLGIKGPDPRNVGMNVTTPHPCSNHWGECGHKREVYGPTAQERRQEAWYESGTGSD